MHRSLLIVGAVALLAACGPKPEGKETTPDAHPGATIPTPANEAAAPDFVEKAALSDLFEIGAAKVALVKSKNGDVKTFAQMMIDAHTKTSADLQAALAASGETITAPTGLSPDLKDKLTALAQAGASDFDEAYMDGQISAHQETLNLMARYANDGKTGPLKTFAINTKDGVQAHLDSAKSLESRLKH